MLAPLYGSHSKVLLFWIVFILTRPFGATFGDLLTKTQAQGGLDLGKVGASAFLGVILVLVVVAETRAEKKTNFS